MSSVADLVGPAFRLFTVVEVMTRYLSLMLLVAGLTGYFSARRIFEGQFGIVG